jgi:response regulator of citrate/malate metabolism
MISVLIIEDSKNIATIYHDIIEDILKNKQEQYIINMVSNSNDYNNKFLHTTYNLIISDWFIDNNETADTILLNIKYKPHVILISGFINKMNDKISLLKKMNIINELYQKPVLVYGDNGLEQIFTTAINTIITGTTCEKT